MGTWIEVSEGLGMRIPDLRNSMTFTIHKAHTHIRVMPSFIYVCDEETRLNH